MADRSLNPRMRACLDVAYRDDKAVAACVLFCDWTDANPCDEIVERFSPVAPYEPGHFYRRELPALLDVLGRVTGTLETLVIDGYVWLDSGHRPGLGAHLFEALGESTPVIGVAKTVFRGAPAVEVFRGKGHRPLYVSSAGMTVDAAAEFIRKMHGAFRIPTLIKRADSLCRSVTP